MILSILFVSKQHPSEDPCWDRATGCSQWTAQSISITQPRWSVLFPQGPAEKQPLTCLGCPWVPADSSMAAIAWQWACNNSAQNSSSAASWHINSDHQKHQWQHQGEADVDFFVKKGNLCWCGYNKNNSSVYYVIFFAFQNPISSRKSHTV